MNRLPETIQVKPGRVRAPREKAAVRRPRWRQRLVEAERGMTDGLRRDSSLFFHFFTGCVTIAVGAVLGLTVTQWALLVLASTVGLSAELFHQVLRTLLAANWLEHNDSVRRALRIATAAVFVAIAGSAAAILLLFAQRLSQLLAG